MLGQKPRLFKQHTAISLEDLVPPGNFYRDVEAKLDLSFVRDVRPGSLRLGHGASID